MASLEVSTLSDVELRSKLAECGHPVGPVTETTRKILIKKLKLLMKAKNSSKRSLSRFSSGDDSGSDTDQNGGKRNLRKVSMPPPSSFKSTRRKTYIQNASPDVSPVPGPSIAKPTSSTPVRPSRNNQESNISRFFTPAALKPTQFSPGTRSRINASCSYDFESDSDEADFSQSSLSSFRRKSGPTYGTLSSYRSRLNNSHSNQASNTAGNLLFSRLRNDSKREYRPFLSNFVGKFFHMNADVNPQDIKETDVEDYRLSDKFLNVNVSSSRGFSFSNALREMFRPFKTFYRHLKSRDNSVLASHWMSINNSQWLSMFLLGLFLLFFVWLVLAYFKATHRPGLIGKSTNFNLLCTDMKKDENWLNCIKSNLTYAIQLYKQVHSELQSKGLKSICGPHATDGTAQKPYMTEKEVVMLLRSSDQLGNSDDINLENGIRNLKLLIMSNKHWGISLIKQSEDFEPTLNDHIPHDKLLRTSNVDDTDVQYICSALPIPWTCYIMGLFYNFIYLVFKIILVLCVLNISFFGIKYYKKMKQNENDQVMEMVERILEYMSENAEKANLSGVDANGSISSLPCEYVAVRHVHDTLIHPTERRKLAAIWDKAVKFIDEHESRIRTEIQQVWGEDATVWRWLGPSLNRTQASSGESNNETNHLYPDLTSLKADSRKSFDRVWQGEAFETSEGSMNALPSSSTQCLKIRHMFKHDRDYGPDWVVQIRDAIVEKCEGAKIVHLSVDQESTEGCVYVKCASQKDAGLAYRKLHGSWFDGALITVKYLRLERYHERFPDSMYASVPLRPSNNLRRSLQGSAGGT